MIRNGDIYYYKNIKVKIIDTCDDYTQLNLTLVEFLDNKKKQLICTNQLKKTKETDLYISTSLLQ